MPGMVRSRRGRLVVEVVVSPERRPSFPALPMPGLCPRCCMHHPICPLPRSYDIGGVTLPISQSQPLTRREQGAVLRPQMAPWMSPCPGSRLLRLWGHSGTHCGCRLPPEQTCPLVLPLPQRLDLEWAGGAEATGPRLADPQATLMPCLLSCCFLASPRNATVAIFLGAYQAQCPSWPDRAISGSPTWATGFQEAFDPNVLVAWSTFLSCLPRKGHLIQ